MAGIPGILHEIELSLAPVFLLTAREALRAFVGGRLDRILDDPESGAIRRRLIRSAIRCLIVAATLVCVIVGAIFLQDYGVMKLTVPITALSIATVALIAAGLVCAPCARSGARQDRRAAARIRAGASADRSGRDPPRLRAPGRRLRCGRAS